MKVSVNWLKKYVEIGEGLSDKLTSIGLEVTAEGHFSLISKKLVVGEVKELTKHPNADKLQVTKVNIGNKEPLNIVCGAPNVKQGQKVVVAPLGTQLTLGEAIVTIKKTKIRGITSEGMLCSEAEIGISSFNEGIMELPEKAEAGKSLCDFLGILPDKTLEIDITPDRGDALSHIGVARDLCAVYKQPLLLPKANVNLTTSQNTLPVQVKQVNSQLCPRYSCVALQGIIVKESPVWLRNRLIAIGITPVNNIVDVTNFVMHELGQPLHAFDYDKITFPISVCNGSKSKSFETINGNKVELVGNE